MAPAPKASRPLGPSRGCGADGRQAGISEEDTTALLDLVITPPPSTPSRERVWQKRGLVAAAVLLGVAAVGAISGTRLDGVLPRAAGAGKPGAAVGLSANTALEAALATARTMKNRAQNVKDQATAVEEKAGELEEVAEGQRKKAEDEAAQSQADKTKAAQLRTEARAALAKAATLEEQAAHERTSAAVMQKQAAQELREAASMSAEGNTIKAQYQKVLHHAKAAEKGALESVKASRVCVGLPGVMLKGDEPQTYEGVATAPSLRTAEACELWCQEHEDCRQAVFSAESSTCQLFGEASTEPTFFRDAFNSSYCGPKEEKEDMMDMLHKVYKMKPWIAPIKHCAWAGSSCMESKCCANVDACNWNFQSCQRYNCYQKDKYFAGCKMGPAPGYWDGTLLGTHNTVEVKKAPSGVLTQGTSLFCFSVVMWNQGPTMAAMDAEGAVANNWKSKGLGIMQCDDHAFYDGLPGGSAHNIDSFVHAWKMVKADGRWARHDWVVKCDVDAVFFPERLRWHIKALRTPQGWPVYLRNTAFKFHFLGAIEVLSREAMQLYFERSWECTKHVGFQGGEDYWLLSCLEGIGVDYQSDYQLLNDKYAANGDCNSDWVVAFHFYKSVVDWNACHQAAIDAFNAKHPQVAQ